MRALGIHAILGLVLVGCMVAIGGCSSYRQPGETTLERKVRHQRTMRANYRQMVEDIDKALMLDTHSKANQKVMP